MEREAYNMADFRTLNNLSNQTKKHVKNIECNLVDTKNRLGALEVLNVITQKTLELQRVNITANQAYTNEMDKLLKKIEED